MAAELQIGHLDRERAAEELRQLLASAARPHGHVGGGVGREFQDLARARTLDAARVAQRFRDTARARTLSLILRPSPDVLDRLRGCDRPAVERGLVEAAYRTLRERLPQGQGFFCARWDDRGPSVVAHLSSRTAEDLVLDRVDTAALEVAWGQHAKNAFRIDRIEAIERQAAENPPQRLVLPVRELLPDLTEGQLVQEGIRADLYQQVVDAVTALINRRPYVSFTREDDATSVVLNYNSPTRPEELADKLRGHFRSPAPTAVPEPAHRTHYDIVRVSVPEGARLFSHLQLDDLRRLARDAVYRAADVHPRHTLLVTPHFRGDDLEILVIINPRNTPSRRGLVDVDAVRSGLEARLAQRLAEDAIRYDSLHRPLPGIPAPAKAEEVPVDRFRSQEYRPRPEADQRVRTKHPAEWLRQPLSHFTVRLVHGQNILGQLPDDASRREVLQEALHRAYPQLKAADIRDNFSITTGPQGESDIKVFFPRTLLSEQAARDYAMPAHVYVFTRHLMQAAQARGVKIPPPPDLPKDASLDRFASGLAFGVRAWQRVQYAQYVSDDPGRALAGELQARFGNPAAVLNIVRKTRTSLKAFSKLANLAPPTPVTTAVRAAAHFYDFVSVATSRNETQPARSR